MQDIADACGVTKAALYYYFRNKYDLLQQLYDSVTAQFYSQIDLIASSDEPLDLKLREAVERQVIYSMNHGQFQKVFYQERKELTGEARKAIAVCERKYEQTLMDIIAEGQHLGLFRQTDPVLATMMILGLLSSVHRWVRYVGLDKDRVVEGIVDQVMKGILAGGH